MKKVLSLVFVIAQVSSANANTLDKLLDKLGSRLNDRSNNNRNEDRRDDRRGPGFGGGFGPRHGGGNGPGPGPIVVTPPVVVVAPSGPSTTSTFRCKSINGNTASVKVTSNKYITNLNLLSQLSGARCTENWSYGISEDRQSMWCTKGCEGDFNAIVSHHNPNPPVVVNPPYHPPHHPPYNPPYNPPYTPPTYGPACELYGYGVYAGYFRNYRIAIGGQIIDSSDSFDRAMETIEFYQRRGQCGGYAREQVKLEGYGVYAGYFRQFRVSIGREMVFGTDDFNQAMSVSRSLRRYGLARRPESKSCPMEGYGVYAGYFRQFRLSVGNEMVYGTDSRVDAFNKLDALRDNGYCW